MKAPAPILFIVFTVTLDAMGVGLIMPVMPELIREIRGTSISDAALWGGLMSFTYAAMQFLFGPLLGNLSDRFGRRPVLIISLICMGLDYLLLALAPTLVIFFIARLISGITGAPYSTAFAYLADISDKGQRASNFGMVGAAFGIGFVIGPAIGGMLGELGLRMPFFVAAGFAFANALFGYFVLPETLAPESRRKFEWRRANPFSALLNLRHLPFVGGLMLVTLLSSIAGHSKHRRHQSRGIRNQFCRNANMGFANNDSALRRTQNRHTRNDDDRRVINRHDFHQRRLDCFYWDADCRAWRSRSPCYPRHDGRSIQ